MALFQVLREELITAMERKQLKKPVMVGVITPYREQVACIQTTLTYVLGCELASEVRLTAPREVEASVCRCTPPSLAREDGTMGGS